MRWKILKDDSFTIGCDIAVVRDDDDGNSTAASSPFVVMPPSDMHEHSGLSSSEDHGATDVTFEVGGKMFAAHRRVLAVRSSVSWAP
ncbi:hypothetical protein E2562_006662 [Oryza meyeriana var. granulata]|uniref:BTB domain-containing protein n=1 Tax=Oryza meyeriana var. granulata TaxID=110450 RepID=A0A6G1EFX2_9ORYZ|nr:hypothetical protein E2562_006662 [Oryza meyeriana var. granulata]